MLLIDLDETLVHSVPLDLNETPKENFDFVLDVSTVKGTITDVSFKYFLKGKLFFEIFFVLKKNYLISLIFKII